VHLDFALEPQATKVTARLEIERLSGTGPLILLGEVRSCCRWRWTAAAGRGRLPAGRQEPDHPQPPDKLTLEIVSEINPAANTELEGLFLSSGMFCTQCEPEGFRRITYFLDRPDNLSVFTVRMEADMEQYPVLLSTAIASKASACGRTALRGVARPFPQTVLPLRTGGGRAGQIHGSFTTMTGRKIALDIYVEHGNEPRARYPWTR